MSLLCQTICKIGEIFHNIIVSTFAVRRHANVRVHGRCGVRIERTLNAYTKTAVRTNKNAREREKNNEPINSNSSHLSWSWLGGYAKVAKFAWLLLNCVVAMTASKRKMAEKTNHRRAQLTMEPWLCGRNQYRGENGRNWKIISISMILTSINERTNRQTSATTRLSLCIVSRWCCLVRRSTLWQLHSTYPSIDLSMGSSIRWVWLCATRIPAHKMNWTIIKSV